MRFAFLFAFGTLAYAGQIYAPGISPAQPCIQTGNTCRLDGLEYINGPDSDPMETYGWVTENSSPTALSVTADSTLYWGEIISGTANYAGNRTMHRAGTAQFLLEWDLRIWGAYGTATIDAPGIQMAWDISTQTPQTGSAWSDPIQVMPGHPLDYSFSLAGNLFNPWGDCCGGMDLTAKITDWRMVSDVTSESVSPVPEPSMLIPFVVVFGAVLTQKGRLTRR